jgi:putative intracellular protease/amidase
VSIAFNVSTTKPKRVAIVVSNPAVSKETGWQKSFIPIWEFVQNGYDVEIFSPDGGRLEGDEWSDSRDDSKYSAEDILSLGFINSTEHRTRIEQSKFMGAIKLENFEALLFVGGQGPMYTFFNDERVHKLAAQFYEAGKILAVICHATCILLVTKLSDGKLLVEGKTWTGFANSEEQYADLM